MRVMARIGDLAWLNLLFVLCSVPIVTAGAAYTALDTVFLAVMRKEEGYITKAFLTAFKKNFKRVTPLWLGMLAAYGVLFFDLYILVKNINPQRGIIFGILCVALFLLAAVNLYTFALTARFANSVKNTLKNALVLSLSQFFITVTMLVDTVLLFVITYYSTYFVPLVLLFGFSGPAFINSYYFNRLFEKLEKNLKNRELIFLKPDAGNYRIDGGSYDGMLLSSLYETRGELFGNEEGRRFPMLVRIMEAVKKPGLQVQAGQENFNQPERGAGYQKEILIKNSDYTVCRFIIDGEINLKQDSPFLNIRVTDGEGRLNNIDIKQGDHFIVPCGFGKYKLSGRLTVVMSAAG